MSEIYRAPGGFTAELTDERSMGDVEVELKLRRKGGATLRFTDPCLGGMAVGRDGRYLYVQERYHGQRERKTYSLSSGKLVKQVHHPSSFDDIIMVTDFRSSSGKPLPEVGDGRFRVCHPPFELPRPLERASRRPTAAGRRAALDEVLSQPPSQDHWRDLLTLFRHWQGPTLAGALADAREALSRWSDERRTPADWMDWLTPHPAWELITAKPTSLVIQGRREDCGDEGAFRLAAWPLLSELTELGLRDCAIGPLGAEMLADSAQLAKLTSLDLNDNPIGDAGVQAMVRSRRLTQLQRLRLAGCGIGPAGATALASCERYTKLGVLVLERNPIGDEGIVALARSPHLFGSGRPSGEPAIVWCTDGHVERTIQRKDLHRGLPLPEPPDMKAASPGASIRLERDRGQCVPVHPGFPYDVRFWFEPPHMYVGVTPVQAGHDERPRRPSDAEWLAQAIRASGVTAAQDRPEDAHFRLASEQDYCQLYRWLTTEKE